MIENYKRRRQTQFRIKLLKECLGGTNKDKKGVYDCEKKGRFYGGQSNEVGTPTKNLLIKYININS